MVQSVNTIKSNLVPASKKSYFLLPHPGKQHPNACVGANHHVVATHIRRVETKVKFSQRVPNSPDIWDNKGQLFSAVFAVVLGLSQPNVPPWRRGQQLWVKVKARGGERTRYP